MSQRSTHPSSSHLPATCQPHHQSSSHNPYKKGVNPNRPASADHGSNTPPNRSLEELQHKITEIRDKQSKAEVELAAIVKQKLESVKELGESGVRIHEAEKEKKDKEILAFRKEILKLSEELDCAEHLKKGRELKSVDEVEREFKKTKEARRRKIVGGEE